MSYISLPMRIAAFAIVLAAMLALASCINPGPPEYQGLPGGIVSVNGNSAFTDEELQSFTRIPEHSDTGIMLDPYQPQGAIFDIGLKRDETTVVWPETVTQSGTRILTNGEAITVSITYDQNRLYHIATKVDSGDLTLGDKAARECCLLGFTNFIKRMKQKAARGEGDMREMCLEGEKYILSAYGREILIKLYIDAVPDESVTLGAYWAYEGDFEPIPVVEEPQPTSGLEENEGEAMEQIEEATEEEKLQQGKAPKPREREPST